MIPVSYALKKLVVRHGHQMWHGEQLVDLIDAPIFTFTDQEKFESEKVRTAAQNLMNEPLHLPHKAVLFEVSQHHHAQITEEVVFAKQTEHGIDSYLFATSRTGEKWTDPLVRACFKQDRIVDIETRPGPHSPWDGRLHAKVLISVFCRALAILAQSPSVSDAEVPRTRRPKLARVGVTGWTWHIVDINPERMRSASLSAGGTHASPRWHIRRGHWRTLSNGRRVFVRSCEVGDIEQGAVFKDYHVEMGAAA